MIEQFKGAARSMISVSALAAALTASLALSGCDKLPGAKSADGAAASAQSPGEKAKLSGYTESYNKLIGTFGLVETAEGYAEREISRHSAQDSLSISDGWIDQSLDKLKAARAMPGGPKALDQAADVLIADLDKVLARLRPLKVYYDSKAYREDGLARGKAEDPLMKAEFGKALADLEAFSTALVAERHKHAASELAALKAHGDMLGYNSKLALQQAETLIGLFKTPKDISDPAVLAQADAQVAQLEKTLADQRAAFAEAKAKATKEIDQPHPAHGWAAANLTSLIGDYRDLKQSHKVEDLNDMTKNYNDAVDDLNHL